MKKILIIIILAIFSATSCKIEQPDYTPSQHMMPYGYWWLYNYNPYYFYNSPRIYWYHPYKYTPMPGYGHPYAGKGWHRH